LTTLILASDRHQPLHSAQTGCCQPLRPQLRASRPPDKSLPAPVSLHRRPGRVYDSPNFLRVKTSDTLGVRKLLTHKIASRKMMPLLPLPNCQRTNCTSASVRPLKETRQSNEKPEDFSILRIQHASTPRLPQRLNRSNGIPPPQRRQGSRNPFDSE
jgi:hypothetical protein